MTIHEVLPTAPRRSIRIAQIGGERTRTITLTVEPDAVAFVGYSRESGYSSMVFMRRAYRQVGFGCGGAA